MLNIKQKSTIEGEFTKDGKSVAGFRAEIDSEAPENMHIAVWQNDKEAYKANRVEARQAQAEFEDYAYAYQDELIAKAAATEA